MRLLSLVSNSADSADTRRDLSALSAGVMTGVTAVTGGLQNLKIICNRGTGL